VWKVTNFASKVNNVKLIVLAVAFLIRHYRDFLGEKGTMKKRGTREEVWGRTAQATSGGLTRSDLTKNKKGQIVSLKKSQQMTSAPSNEISLAKSASKVKSKKAPAQKGAGGFNFPRHWGLPF
jgi:hypothetical protein